MKRELNEIPVFTRLVEAVRASFAKHRLPRKVLPHIICELEAAAREGAPAKDGMLDLFLCGEIEISRLQHGPVAVFTAADLASPPQAAPSKLRRRRRSPAKR